MKNDPSPANRPDARRILAKKLLKGFLTSSITNYELKIAE